PLIRFLLDLRAAPRIVILRACEHFVAWAARPCLCLAQHGETRAGRPCHVKNSQALQDDRSARVLSSIRIRGEKTPDEPHARRGFWSLRILSQLPCTVNEPRP